MPPEEETKPAGDQAGTSSKDAAGGSGAESEQSGKDSDEKITLRKRAIEAERELEKIQKKQKFDEESKLKEQGKWQELATAEQTKSKTLESQLRKERIERAVVSAAAGANDPEDVVQFVGIPDDLDASDRDALQKHVKAEVKKLKESKPYLFKPADVVDKNTTVDNHPAGNGKASNFDPTKVRKDQVWGLKREDLQKLAGRKG